jgi:hypothetical protein
MKRWFAATAVAIVTMATVACSSVAPMEPTTSATTPPASSTPSSSTPSSVPSVVAPSRTLGELTLGVEGLDSLVIGKPVDTRLAVLDPLPCAPSPQPTGAVPDPSWAAYIPVFPKIMGPYGTEVYPFEAHANEMGELRWLAVQSPEIRTAAGIGIGSTRAEVESAYPDAEVVEKSVARSYGVSGASTRLVIEVRTVASEAFAADVVWTMRVEPLDFRLTSLAGGDAGAFCPA